MFSKLMNRFYYGKSGKSDYTQADLPKNRLDLFFTTLKVRFPSLSLLNVAYFVLWIPALLILINAFVTWANSLAGINELMRDAADAEIIRLTGEFRGYQHALILDTLLKLFPAILITGPFTVGIAYNLRNWARDEHAFMWSDIWDSIKQNWKQAIGVSAISGLMPLIAYVGFVFYGDMSQNNVLMVIPQVLVLLAALIWALGTIFFYYLIVNYNLRFRDVLRNGVLLSIAKFPKALGIKLLHLLPIAMGLGLSMIVNIQVGILFILAFYAIIGLALSRFINASFSNACFENIINPRIAGAPTDVGLRSKEYAELDKQLASIEEEEDGVYIHVEDKK